MNTSFRILGIVNEPGRCELCGTVCPVRRVAVEIDGGDVAYWGVVCAAEARSGRRSSAIARELLAEAENAGDYAGPVPAFRRGRGPRPLSARAAAHQAAHDATEARTVWFRTSSAVPAGLDEAAAADYRYRQTGRPMAGSFLAADDAAQLARIDGTDHADVDRFARLGFARLETVTA